MGCLKDAGRGEHNGPLRWSREIVYNKGQKVRMQERDEEREENKGCIEGVKNKAHIKKEVTRIRKRYEEIREV
ncbi:MAG: hypothetical protein D6780_07215 [Candidatus Dadabacteria bacterium]|nr:MAG: hypothetical protein D6780_07215 [Candidatus Dadabacteria bacterium]